MNNYDIVSIHYFNIYIDLRWRTASIICWWSSRTESLQHVYAVVQRNDNIIMYS